MVVLVHVMVAALDLVQVVAWVLVLPHVCMNVIKLVIQLVTRCVQLLVEEHAN